MKQNTTHKSKQNIHAAIVAKRVHAQAPPIMLEMCSFL